MAETIVEVQATPLIVDTTQSKAAVNISSEVLTNIPKGRSFQSLIEFAPGSRQEPLQDGYQIDGASDGENVYAVEGLDTGSIQTGASGINVPTEFIQEVQVKSSGFEAEYGGALGGVVQVVQKRGGNTWHGSGVFYYRSNGLQGSDRPTLRDDPAGVREDVALPGLARVRRRPLVLLARLDELPAEPDDVTAIPVVPDAIEELIAAIRCVVSGQSYLSPAITSTVGTKKTA